MLIGIVYYYYLFAGVIKPTDGFRDYKFLRINKILRINKTTPR